MNDYMTGMPYLNDRPDTTDIPRKETKKMMTPTDTTMMPVYTEEDLQKEVRKSTSKTFGQVIGGVLLVAVLGLAVLFIVLDAGNDDVAETSKVSTGQNTECNVTWNNTMELLANGSNPIEVDIVELAETHWDGCHSLPEAARN